MMNFRIKQPLPNEFEVVRPLLTPNGSLNTDYWTIEQCNQFNCGQFERGWMTFVDTKTSLGIEQRDWIRAKSGRRFTEEQLPEGIIRFAFEPGQQCFRPPHRHPIERDPQFKQDGAQVEWNRFVDNYNEKAHRARRELTGR